MTVDKGESPAPPERVPIRTILTTIGLLLATVVALYVLMQIRQILTWIIVAAFFAVALAPVVGWFERHLRGHRSVATLVVFVLVAIALLGLGAVFIVPQA